MAIFPGIVILSERYGSGEPMTDAEIDDLRSNVEPTTWLDLCRTREAAITAQAPRQLGPYAEGAQVRLKSGGPVMTVEDTRDSVKLVQCIWFDDAKHVQRDAFHKDALEAAPAVPRIGSSGLWGEITDAEIDQVAHEILLLLRVLGRIAIRIGSRLPRDLDPQGKDRRTGSRLARPTQ